VPITTNLATARVVHPSDFFLAAAAAAPVTDAARVPEALRAVAPRLWADGAKWLAEEAAKTVPPSRHCLFSTKGGPCRRRPCPRPA
jgi:hypothetical protein